MKNQTDYANKIRDRAVDVMRTLIAKNPEIPNRKAFATAIGTTGTAIFRWENKKGFPSLGDIAIICEKFNINPSYMILGKDMGTSDVNTRLTSIEKRISQIEKKA